MRYVDARRIVFVCNPLPTVRVCMQCGAYWQHGEGTRWWHGTIEHVGPHDPNRREYRRTSPWPKL